MSNDRVYFACTQCAPRLVLYKYTPSCFGNEPNEFHPQEAPSEKVRAFIEAHGHWRHDHPGGDLGEVLPIKILTEGGVTAEFGGGWHGLPRRGSVDLESST